MAPGRHRHSRVVAADRAAHWERNCSTSDDREFFPAIPGKLAMDGPRFMRHQSSSGNETTGESINATTRSARRRPCRAQTGRFGRLPHAGVFRRARAGPGRRPAADRYYRTLAAARLGRRPRHRAGANQRAEGRRPHPRRHNRLARRRPRAERAGRRRQPRIPPPATRISRHWYITVSRHRRCKARRRASLSMSTACASTPPSATR